MVDPDEILKTNFTSANIPEMLEFIRDESNQYSHRHDMIIALGKIKKEAVAVLITLFDDHFPGIRQSAAEALGTIGADANEACAVLEKALNDDDAEVRRSAVKALGKIGPRALQILIKASNHKDFIVRTSALAVLDKNRTQNVPSLFVHKNEPRAIDAIDDFEQEIKMLIRNDPSAVSKLIKTMMVETNIYFRLLILEALEKLGPKARAAVPILLQELEKESCSDMRGILISTLMAIDPEASLK